MKKINFVERHLFLTGHYEMPGGLTIVQEQGRRRFFQICPSCSSTTGTDDTQVAAFIQKWGCLLCRWRESEVAYGSKHRNDAKRRSAGKV